VNPVDNPGVVADAEVFVEGPLDSGIGIVVRRVDDGIDVAIDV
jgi:hypothetical protein